MKLITPISSILSLLCLQLLIPVSLAAENENTNANCIRAAKALARNGDGSTPSSCMGCDPTRRECYFNCQAKVNAVYKFCASGNLPDGYFYDPQSELFGSWQQALPKVKIKVERCGCNAGSHLYGSGVLGVGMVVGVALLLLLG